MNKVFMKVSIIWKLNNVLLNNLWAKEEIKTISNEMIIKKGKKILKIKDLGFYLKKKTKLKPR